MVEKNILLSIIIPVYNVEKYIKECLDSILSCNSHEYEVIIVNDGTPDNSMNIINHYLLIYGNKIKVIEQKNSGLSVARNNGINHAQGKYIWCIDSDDFLEPDSIFNILIKLKKKNNVDVIAMPVNYYINGHKNPDFKKHTKESYISNIDYLKGNYPYGASVRYIIKKNFLKDNQLYFLPNTLHEDGDFGLRLLYYSPYIYILNNAFYNYRIRENDSIMSSWKKKNSEDLIIIYDGLFKLFLQNPLKLEVTPYFDATFHILTATILFASKKWNSDDFKDFYRTHKRDLIRRTKIIRPFCTQSFKKLFKFWLFIISPLFCCKIMIHK